MRLTNSFIGVEGVGERTERQLWRTGVTDWDAFEGPTADGVGPTLAERIHRFIDEARDRLAARDAQFFAGVFPDRERWRLFGDFADRTAYLDIETTGLSQRHDDVTVVSVHQAGETTTLVRGQDLSTGAIEATLADAEVVVTYNGARFDLPFLESALGTRFNMAHIDLLYPCRRLDLTGGLKGVERTLGIERDRPDLSGHDAVRLWRQYDRRGDTDALETLIDYNREDTVNLKLLMETVADRLNETVFESTVSGTADRAN